MEQSRKGWLEDSVGGDLLLGVRWLQERTQSRIDGIKQEPDKAWAPLYQDDGSCLTINPAPTSEERLVRIIETCPLTLADGYTSIRAILTPACLAQLPTCHTDLPVTGIPLGSTLSLRNYAVRCTSYGPPADRLHLVLHAVEWHRGRRHIETFETPHPIISLAPLKRILAGLTDARLQEHRKYVYQDPDPSIMADSSPDDSQMSHSFATQMPSISGGSRAADTDAPRAHPVTNSGVRRNEREAHPQGLPGRGDPGLLALFHKHTAQNSSEKVGNQAQTPIQPQARPLDESPSLHTRQLEFSKSRGSCLFVGNLAQATTVDDLKNFFKNYSVVCTVIATDPHSSRPNDHAFVALSTPSEAERAIAELNGRRLLDREVCIQLSQTSDNHSNGGRRAETTAIQASSKTEFPGWLSGWTFDATTTVVTEEQKDCLLRPEAWHKPPPGVRRSVINIPIEVQKQIEDGFSSLQRPTQTHSNSNDLSAAVVGDDPIHDHPGDSVDEDNQFQSQVSQVSRGSSEITWSSSPPRPSPKQANQPNAALPPDSSLGTAHETPKKDVRHDPHPTSPFGSASGTTPKKDEPLRTPSGSTGPSQSKKSAPSTGLSPFRPPFGSASNSRKNGSKQNAASPRSSSLGRPLHYDLEEDEEMEMSVPLGLGEGLPEDSGMSPVVLPNRTVQSKPYHRSQPTASVQETPRRPGSSSSRAKPPASSPLPSSGMSSRRLPDPVCTAPDPSPRYSSNVSSSTRTAAAGTFAKASQVSDSFLTRKVMEGILGQRGLTTTWPNGKAMLMKDMLLGALNVMCPSPGRGPSSMRPRVGQSATHPIPLSDSDDEMEDVQVQVEQSSSAPLAQDPTLVKDPMSGGQNLRENSRQASGIQDTAQTEPAGPDPTDSSVKRKTETSPSRLNARRPKRRGVSMKGFDSSPSRGHLTAEEAHRQSGQVAQVPATQVASPSTTANATPKATAKAASKATAKATPIAAAKVAPSNQQAQHQDDADGASFEVSRDNSILSTHSAEPPETNSTVFAKFTRAYPDYTGNEAHFINQCKEIYMLYLEDRPVPIFLWDEYLIRNRTDYREYVNKTLDEGKSPEPYLRFFTASVDAPRYTKKILSCAEVIHQALLELGVDPDHEFASPGASLSRSMSAPRGGFQPRASFRGLPQIDGTTDGVDEPYGNRVGHGERELSRQSSLSFAGSRTMGAPRGGFQPRSSSRSLPRFDATTDEADGKQARQSSHSLAGYTIQPSVGLSNGRSERQSTGNAFRDFIIGQQKMTCSTGSLQEDIISKWPGNVALRPALPRRPDVDVLSWKDDL